MIMSELPIKEKILLSANNLFSQRGIREVTIDDVCKDISISKKTFYQFFSQKEDLVDAIIFFKLQQKVSALKNILNQNNTIEALISVIKKISKMSACHSDKIIMRDVKKYYPDTLKKHLEQRSEVIRKIAITYFQKGKEEGYFNQAIDIEAIILLFSLLHKSIVKYLDDGVQTKEKQISGKRLSDTFLFIVQSSILSEKGRLEFNKLNINNIDK